jgi:hypothetical protein
MESTKLQTMGQTPSRFGMPTHGIRLGVYGGTTVYTTSAPTSGDRVAARVWGAFPGTSAWRPPTC